MLTRIHLMGSHIDVFFVHISGHTKVGDLAHFFIAHQYIPSGQIAMDDLNSNQNTSYIIVSLCQKCLKWVNEENQPLWKRQLLSGNIKDS